MERYCDAKKFPRNSEEKEKRNRISTNFIQSKGKRKWYELTDEEKDELNKLIERNVKMITVANGASNLDELKERVSHIYLRRIKEDLQGLPDKKIHEVHYELTQQQQIEYNKLWEEYEMEQYKVDPTKELNKNLLEGAIYRKYLSNEMVPYTIKLTQSLVNKGEKVVIGCCFDEELYTLRDYFGESCVIYNGKMNAKEKDIAVAKFMDDPNTMVFIGNIQSCGVGITLISSCNMVLNTFSYSNADNKQMEDRIYRIGQNRNVNVYYQMFKQTRCEDVWNICLRKDLLSKTIIKKESEK
jgi:SNF2 family DNA or RNA helicase